MFQSKKHLRLSVLLGLCVCTSFLQGAEGAKPVPAPSWLSRCASSVFSVVKTSAFGIAKLAMLQAPVYASEKITDQILPQLTGQQHGACAEFALQAALLAGKSLCVQKAVSLFDGDSEKPLSYYALLLTILALGNQAVSYGAHYWSTKVSTTLTDPKTSLWSWTTARRLAGAAGLVAGSVWLASHMPILASSFVFKTPFSYFSTNHLWLYFMMSGFKILSLQNSAAPLTNTPYFSAQRKEIEARKKLRNPPDMVA